MHGYTIYVWVYGYMGVRMAGSMDVLMHGCRDGYVEGIHVAMQALCGCIGNGLGGILGASRPIIGYLPFEVCLSHPASSWAPLGPSWGDLCLETSWALLEAILDGSYEVLGPSGAALVASGTTAGDGSAPSG